MRSAKNGWDVVYKRAITRSGELLFPERLSLERLEEIKLTMGSYLYANQYLNVVVPDDEKKLKVEWLKRTSEMRPNTQTYRFAFIDPAIGQKEKVHDYTAIVVVHADYTKHWHLQVANRYRLTPTQIVDKVFELHDRFGVQSIGVEAVAYQEALIYLIQERMQQTGKYVPLKPIKRGQTSKQTRILSLVPRFEWGGITIHPGLADFEEEYSTFPRGTHDDILDALASVEEIVYYPEKREQKLTKPNSMADPNYEKFYIQQLGEQKKGQPNAINNQFDSDYGHWDSFGD